MTRVIHTGDTHLGYRQYHRSERREDFLVAFRRVAADAVDDGVDALVHAGDLFHDRRPGLPDLLGTLNVLETLADAGVPFLAVVGNHETKRDAQWLDLFEALGLATRLGAEPVVVGDTAFYGLDFVPRSRREDLGYEFEAHDADHAALVSHGLFEPLVPDYGNIEWDIRAVLDAANVEFDAVLLGDEHAPTRERVDGTWVTYCGSTERTSAAERDERGYNIVEFDDDAYVTRRGIETREFVFVDLDLEAGEGFERVRDRLREYDIEAAVVHVTLTGDGEDVSAARLEEFADDEGALVARVNDRREIAEDEGVEVSFADPDEAVRERVRELGLSNAARDLDETIRASKVANSNVADEVERRIDELLDEPEAFEPAPDEAPETVADRLPADESCDSGENDVDAADSDDADGATGASSDDADGATGAGSDDADAATADGGPPPEGDVGGDQDTERQADESADDPTTETVEAEDGGAGGEEGAEPAAADDGDGDGQASMEDYL